MKGFTREHTEFSLCGLNCLLCPMQVGGYCPGCGGPGNQSCTLARCSMDKGGYNFCSQCPTYPCARYDEFDAADSFVPHSRRAADLDRARELGLDAYIGELRAKRAILDKLLANYNDGRRKTFYCAAVYLLPLEDLKNVVAKLEDQPECSVKERAAAAVKLLQGAVAGHGVCLKLKKKKG